MSELILKRASASRWSGQWRDDDYEVLENGVVVGRSLNYLPDEAPGSCKAAIVARVV
jgi:hypothetical protein